jgi:hypothetical protein
MTINIKVSCYTGRYTFIISHLNQEKFHPEFKITSGGQTGVDRAGVDAGMEFGLPVGGYIPKGKLGEVQVPDKYPVMETRSKDYKSRIKRNVIESDGTLFINICPGATLTAKLALETNKALMIIQLDQDYQRTAVIKWFQENKIQILNIAGLRESKIPGIHDQAKKFLNQILSGYTG